MMFKISNGQIQKPILKLAERASNSGIHHAGLKTILKCIRIPLHVHVRNIFLTAIFPILVVKQSVMKHVQVIAKYLTENVGRGAGVVATGMLCLVITNFRIRVH